MILSELERSNLQGLPLRVAAVMSKDYAYDTSIVRNSDGTIKFENSFAVELLKALEFTMNFTTIPLITTAWGHTVNKTWVGMIALLLSDKADIGLSSIADRPFRREVVDFNIPTNQIRLAAFFQRPSAFASHYNALIKPFHPFCWIVLLLVMTTMIFTSYAISTVLSNIHSVHRHHHHNVTQNLTMNQVLKESPKFWECKLFMNEFSVQSPTIIKPKKRKSLPTQQLEPKLSWSLADCVLWTLTTVTLRGFYNVPSDTPRKILMLAGSLSGVVLYAAYGGTLVSFLSVIIEPIQTLGQLLATDFIFAIVADPLAIKFFAESPDVKGVMLFNRRQTEASYTSMKEAYEKINKGSFVFVTDHAGAYESLTNDFSTQEACKIREIDIENAEQQQGPIVQKKSKYKRIIDYQILRTIQYGLVKRWSSRFLKSKPLCESSSEYEGVALASTSLSFAILILFGWLIAVFSLILEVLIYKRST